MDYIHLANLMCLRKFFLLCIENDECDFIKLAWKKIYWLWSVITIWVSFYWHRQVYIACVKVWHKNEYGPLYLWWNFLNKLYKIQLNKSRRTCYFLKAKNIYLWCFFLRILALCTVSILEQFLIKSGLW